MVDLSSTITSLMGAKAQEFLGVEFSSGSVRIAHLKTVGNKKKIVALLDKDVQSLSEAEVGQFIARSVFSLNVKNPRITYIVPSHLMITKNIELPSQDPKEIEDIVNLQASRHTPYGREEIAVDYINIGTYKKNYTKILLVIVNRQVVRKNFEILRKAGIEPEKITFSSEVVGNILAHALKLEKEQAPVGTIHIDTAFSDFSILLGDKIIFVRSIPIGIQHLTAKDKHRNQFVEEIKKSLEVYRNEDVDTLPTRIIIAGVGTLGKDLAPLLNAELKIPTEGIDCAEYFSFTDDAQKMYSSAKFVSFLGAMSATLAFDKIGINLIPEEVKLKRLFEERSREVIKTGILLLTIFVLLCGFLGSKIYLKKRYLEKIDQRFRELHRKAEVVEEQFDRIRLIKSYLSQRGVSVEVLGEFYNLIPDDVKILEIRFDRAGSFSFKGTASTMAVIFSFVEDLNKSGYFREVTTRYTSKRMEGKDEVADFEIVATFGEENETDQ